MKGFTNKQPKIVAGSANVITRILKYVDTLWLDAVLTLYILLLSLTNYCVYVHSDNFFQGIWS